MAKREIDVSALLDLVPFSPEEVVDAGCGNTALYVDAIRYRLRCLETASNAKRIWETACAEKDLQLRQQARAAGEKITEGYIDAKILLDKKIARLAEEHEQAEVYDEYSKLIVKVFEMRRDMLHTVSQMVCREYPAVKMAEQAADRMEVERRKLRKRFPEK
jgi:hypothetical protein